MFGYFSYVKKLLFTTYFCSFLILALYVLTLLILLKRAGKVVLYSHFLYIKIWARQVHATSKSR